MRLILCVASLAMAVQGQGYRIAPVDDTYRDAGFKSFAAKLNHVALKRDVKGLQKLLDPGILTGTGNKTDPEEKGWKAFAERWRPADADSPLWEALTDILALGCERMHPKLFVGPYLVWKFPRNLDPEKYVVLTRDQVVLRASPDRDGRPVMTLSFDVVERLEESADGQWMMVRVNGVRDGYVPAQVVRSSLTPRAQFAQEGGGWRMVALEVPE